MVGCELLNVVVCMLFYMHAIKVGKNNVGEQMTSARDDDVEDEMR